jgi:ubiquinone/menaquinone biosynthesis C-methylase UbiE
MIEYLFLAVLVVIMYAVSLWGSTREGFTADVVLEDNAIYDSEYAKIYKALWHSSKELWDFEQVSLQEMLADKTKTDVKILDMCCGIAQHSCFFKSLNVGYTGVDISESMLAEARSRCPNTYQKGDITDTSLFAPKTFSHAMMLGFSIYQFANPKMATDNAYVWLQPGGTLVLHLVEPDKYDPLLELASPFAAFSLQKYSSERQTKSDVFFDQFKYSGEFKKKKNEDDAIFHETMTRYTGTPKYRENIHHWHMPSLDRMIEIVKTSGFRLKEKIDLVKVGKEYQYLVFFEK